MQISLSLLKTGERNFRVLFLFSKLEKRIPNFSFSSRLDFLASRQCLIDTGVSNVWIEMQSCGKIDYFPGNDPVTPVSNVPQIAQNWPLAPQETPVAGFGADPCPNCHHYQLIPPSPVCLISQGNVHIVSDFSAQRSDSIVKFVKLAKV